MHHKCSIYKMKGLNKKNQDSVVHRADTVTREWFAEMHD